jgi:hypothetical protein
MLAVPFHIPSMISRVALTHPLCEEGLFRIVLLGYVRYFNLPKTTWYGLRFDKKAATGGPFLIGWASSFFSRGITPWIT